jgi:hypothetical protein
MWEAVAEFAHLHSDHVIPTNTRDTHLAAAAAMRSHMDKECTKDVCAVCSCYKRTCDITSIPPASLDGLHLLDASREKTSKLPRVGLTTVTIDDTTYCLQPYACIRDASTSVTHINVCNDCKDSLAASRVPKTSLVAFDTGNG